MQPLEHIYIGSRAKRTKQPAEIVAYQGRQYTIFYLNAENADTNETSSTGTWSWMGLRPTTAEEHPQGRLLGEPRATRALLQLLASTSVALPRAHLQRTAVRAQRHDEWELGALEEVRTGEG